MESEERPTKMRKLGHDHGIVNDVDVEAAAPLEDLGSKNVHTALADEQNAERIEELEDQVEEEPHTGLSPIETGDADEAGDNGNAAPKISKNQLKKQRRLEKWEAGREDRKIKRKEKIQAKKQRRRDEAKETGVQVPRNRPPRGGPIPGNVPITVVFDCDFEDLMFDNEMKSLGLQLTRCYSDNRKAKHQAHLAISSFKEGGKLKERFDGILAKQYLAWKGVKFYEEDFVHAAEESIKMMKEKDYPPLPESITGGVEPAEEAEGEIVYLSSESDVILERLKPNSTYIIGGLVDKNRHKGFCYKRAVNRGIKTAKLPIGEFLQMNSRQVLVTNHVLEIMLKWMEFGDWGKAFMEVIPKRKGGVLKSEVEGEDVSTPHVEGDASEDGEQEIIEAQDNDGNDEEIMAVEEVGARNNRQDERIRASQHKTTPCRFFAAGTCKKGDSCTYIHDRS